ncbi:hypothetical protein LEP1GSC188_4626 [Leptospira weilii serovar Topaz str. LT2116]|uniref:Integrase core domain protein n=1 Tax=Leptospira weilii serovar Topaz str. LT2116 TaxID=1088540 RepID=M3GU17_9LEPT|nr:hypothetical protein LEP1GSC188_4626 [Leptospira weilii serovar Topaz str. LT2116]
MKAIVAEIPKELGALCCDRRQVTLSFLFVQTFLRRTHVTYIKIKDGFTYFSLITDLYSRKIVGFKLHHSLETEGCIHALNMLLHKYQRAKRLSIIPIKVFNFVRKITQIF